jgi:hypothetical protein
VDYALERTTAWVTGDVAAPVTLRTGVAEEPGELGDELVVVGVELELGEGLDG